VPTHLADSRSSRSELHLYTGTLIKDLFAAVERAEHRAQQRSVQQRSEQGAQQAAASRSGEGLNRQRTEEFKTEAACRAIPKNLEPEKLPQTLGLSAADWNLALLLIVHAQLVRTLEPGYNFANSINVHQVGAVSPPEQSRVQAGE
jgi:hypothetical protein